MGVAMLHTRRSTAGSKLQPLDRLLQLAMLHNTASSSFDSTESNRNLVAILPWEPLGWLPGQPLANLPAEVVRS